jgi:hypothetical protein
LQRKKRLGLDRGDVLATPPERMSRRIRSERIGRRPSGRGAVLMILGIVAALAYVFFLRTPPPVPVPKATAAQGTYRWKSQVKNSAGQITVTVAEDGAFSAVAAGNAGGRVGTRATANRFGRPQGEVDASVYDAVKRRELTEAQWPSGPRYDVTAGAWPPVWQVATHSPLDYQGLAAVVRSAVEDHDHKVGIKPIKEGERKVWRAAMTFPGDDVVELVVDQQSGLVTWYSEDTPAALVTFTAAPAWADPPPANETYSLAKGSKSDLAHAQVAKDTTFAPAPTPAAAARRAGYQLLDPTLVPDGFALRAVATRRSGNLPVDWLGSKTGGRPPMASGELGVALLYTRGLTWFTVDELGPRATHAFAGFVRGQIGTTAATKLSFESEELQYGWFTGATAYTWYEKSGPALFVSGGRRTVYVTGALSRQELITLAEGLKPLG